MVQASPERDSRSKDWLVAPDKAASPGPCGLRYGALRNATDLSAAGSTWFAFGLGCSACVWDIQSNTHLC